MHPQAGWVHIKWEFTEEGSGLFLGRKLETRPIGIRGGSDDRQRKWAIENEKAKSKQEVVALGAGGILLLTQWSLGDSYVS